jgi:lipopolysaccharide/colanic/teichoic acid biosynthesis glycosyltransferase
LPDAIFEEDQDSAAGAATNRIKKSNTTIRNKTSVEPTNGHINRHIDFVIEVNVIIVITIIFVLIVIIFEATCPDISSRRHRYQSTRSIIFSISSIYVIARHSY